MLKADLKVLGGKQHGKLIPLLASKFLIGREQDCQLRPNSELVSRHHCVFTVDDYTVRLRDLGSTNGTLVNGQKIRGQVELNAGDRVKIGKLEMEVVIRAGVRQAVPAAAGADVPAVPIDNPTPPPGAEPQLASDTDTGQISATETSYEMPTQVPQILDDTAPNVGAEAGDTTVMYNLPEQPPAQQAPPQAIEPQPPPAQPVAPQPPQAPMPPAQPNYPQGMPQPDPMQGQMPQPAPYPPGAMPYPPQMPYPQYGTPYPQMPPQYFQPGMPYQQQPMMPQPAPAPAPAPPPEPPPEIDDAMELDGDGHVPAPPIKLPDPGATGASPEKPVVGSEGTKKREAGEEGDVKPYEKAAELIKQMVERRPGGSS